MPTSDPPLTGQLFAGTNVAKRIVKRVPLIRVANAAWRARALRRGNAGLARHYCALTSVDRPYDPAFAIATALERLAARGVQVRAKPLGGLRIFWVGANRSQDYGGLLQGLRKLGSVTEFATEPGGYGPTYVWPRFHDARNAARNGDALVRQVTEALRAGPLDLLMGQMWRAIYPSEALAAIHALGVPTVNIAMDDRLPEMWKPIAGLRQGPVGLGSVTDLVLTSAPETCAWYQAEGVPALFFPMASDPGIFHPWPVRRYAATFVGSRYGVREKIVKALWRARIPLEVFGPGWPNGAVGPADAARIFGESMVVIGVGTLGHTEDMYTLKLRDFDAPMSGALYVTHRNPDLAEFYVEDKEIVLYGDASECVSKIRYYLDHPDDRERIAAAGHDRAVRSHTWERRFATLFEDLGWLERWPGATQPPSKLAAARTLARE